jgi:hypothetical protein
VAYRLKEIYLVAEGRTASMVASKTREEGSVNGGSRVVGRRWPGVATLQGSYYLVTGAWPILHLPSFAAVTGPKPEGWLVKMVGLLSVAIGGCLLMASRRRITPEVRWLGMASAAAFGGIDVWYAARRRISPVYLLDAAVEGVFLTAWQGGER